MDPDGKSSTTVYWRRTIHILGGLIPLSYGVLRWQTILSIHSFLLVGGLYFTVAVLLARGRAVRLLSQFVQISITFIFLDLALRHVRIAELWNTLRDIKLPVMALAMLIFSLGVWFRGYRWYFLLSAKDEIHPMDAVKTTYINFFGNYALPARAGEVMRVLMLSATTGARKSTITAGVVLEKIADLMALVLVVVYLIAFSNLAGPAIKLLERIIIIISVVIIIILTTAFLLNKQYSPSEAGENPSVWMRFRGNLFHFVNGLQPISHPSELVKFVLYSLISWSLLGLACWTFISSQGLSGWLSMTSQAGVVTSIILIVVLVQVSSTIPAGPGSAGPYQAAVLLAFVMLRTGAGEPGSLAYHNAAGFSIVYWVGQTIPSVLVGGIILIRSGMARQIIRVAEKAGSDRLMPPDDD